MSDGESREPPRPAGEVRVPIPAPPPRRPAEQPPEDAGTGSGSGSSPAGSPGRDPPPDLASEEEEQVPYPALAPTAFFCLKQTTRPRSWCLRLVCNPYPFPRDTAPPGMSPRARSIPSGLRIPRAPRSQQRMGMARSHRGPLSVPSASPLWASPSGRGTGGFHRPPVRDGRQDEVPDLGGC
ncbi:voltage-dependent T-type calcium channel subunit alpha-1H-like [Manacus candei]|uniref:voltage-dependent T-type calcium channel subunit alpha-1H-like n=1 Tax=Manacus candei TaxID=415023 RepID=UPI002227F144|nr:voltage-dependent T-type calcium channel subunit alpha-1H-like [Manacus candei]